MTTLQLDGRSQRQAGPLGGKNALRPLTYIASGALIPDVLDVEFAACPLESHCCDVVSEMAEAPGVAEAVVEALADCSRTLEDECVDPAAARRLKGWAIAVIFLASALGVLIPLTGRRIRFLRADGKPFFVAKLFAAGVILATAFIHMLPTAHEVLSNECLPEDPWHKFAWAGFIAMLGALATLVLDFALSQFYLGRQKHQNFEESKGTFRKSDNQLLHMFVVPFSY